MNSRICISLIVLLVGIFVPISVSSQIVWEQIPTPEGVTIRSFEVKDSDEIYLGTNSGVYRSFNLGTNWEFIGLSGKTVYSFEFNDFNELFCGTKAGLYKLNPNSGNWEFLFHYQTGNLNELTNLYGNLFACDEAIARSLDDGNTWELAFYPPNHQWFKGITATSEDSIFAGATNFVGDMGGVYLSVDTGSNWQHIGLEDHFIASMGVDNLGNVYAGAFGHYYTGQGGLYRYDKQLSIWDTLMYFPYITTIEVTNEDLIYLGYEIQEDEGGVMCSNDYGLTWSYENFGFGSNDNNVKKLKLDNDEHLYALTGYYYKNLYRSSLPVIVDEDYLSQSNFSINIYPNPASNKVNLKLDCDKVLLTKGVIIEFYTMTGKPILRKQIPYSKINDALFSINTRHFKNGLYAYRVINSNIYFTGKILIKQNP